MKIGNLIRVGLAVALMALGGSGVAAEAASPQLSPAALTALPLGSIRPEGWLKCYLDKMTDGVCGRLYEYGDFLSPTNGWISRAECSAYGQNVHFRAHTGWEEQPYWFRSFVKLAALTGNERMLSVCRDWVEKMLLTRDPDGWYGPQPLRSIPLEDGTSYPDLWGHMIMNEALVSWYDYSGDKRVLELLSAFMDYCLAIPENRLLWADDVKWSESAGWLPYIQHERAGDMVSTLFRLYDRTGDAKYIRLADRVWTRYYGKPDRLFLDQHNVNFCQRFSYPGIYARRNGDLALAAESEYWLQQHWLTWGQMPRCAFAADERFRAHCTDPRYGLESCSWGEYVRSFQNLAEVDGEPRWADRTEDVVFNHAPCAYTPDCKMVHYITACNQVSIDARTDHDYENHPPMNAYSATDYRCCLYNAAQPFPVFTENLVKRGRDGKLVFWMYAPHSGKTAEAEWQLSTSYPFRETARLTVIAAKPQTLRFRVPAWATSFNVGATSAPAGARFVEVSIPTGRCEMELRMGAVARFTPWARQNGVSVDRGPLTYSVAIGERYSKVMRAKGKSGSQSWQEVTNEDARKVRQYTEIAPTTPWNWGLEVSVAPRWRECPWNDDCFVATNAPCELIVRGRRLPEWTLQDNEPAKLQLSPAYSAEPLEDIRFTPLGCQRLRLCVLPQVTDNAILGRRWKVPPSSTLRSNRYNSKSAW